MIYLNIIDGLFRIYMEKYKKYLKEFSKLIFPKNVSIEKMESEMQEHFKIIEWVTKRFFIIIAVLYIFSGILTGVNVLDSLFLGFIVFLYSNFLPDADSLFKKLHMNKYSKLYAGYANINKKGKIILGKTESKWYEKYMVLFFTPIFIYYKIFRKVRYFYTTQEKPFHNIKSLCAYASFLLLFGFILYNNVLEKISLCLFGGFGYYIHLFIDKICISNDR